MCPYYLKYKRWLFPNMLGLLFPIIIVLSSQHIFLSDYFQLLVIDDPEGLLKDYLQVLCLYFE